MAAHATAALAAMVGVVLGCAGAASAPAALPAEPPPDGVAVRVRLLFREDADLDLHVTDPLQETVYFGNTPSASGGTLLRDVRCDSDGPRLEEVQWDVAPPGRYRVGVDFPIRCTLSDAPAPFILEVWAGGIRHERRGAISFGRFEPLVYEFDVRGDTPPAPPAGAGP